MKKIVTAFTVLNTPWHVLSFATKIAKKHSATIHGIFVDDSTDRPEFQYPFPNDLSLTKEKFSNKSSSEESNELINDNIKLFKNECDDAGVVYKIDKVDSVSQLIQQAADADVIVADTRAVFLEKILSDAKSPVCLVSETEPPQKAILMYDGNNSCKHAIKKYLTLFPEWSSLPAFLVSINPSGEDEQKIQEYVKNELQPHLKNVTIELLHGNEKKELMNFLGKYPEHVMVIMGAFGRSEISMFFKESLANVVLDKTRLSLLIAHR